MNMEFRMMVTSGGEIDAGRMGGKGHMAGSRSLSKSSCS